MGVVKPSQGWCELRPRVVELPGVVGCAPLVGNLCAIGWVCVGCGEFVLNGSLSSIRVS